MQFFFSVTCQSQSDSLFIAYPKTSTIIYYDRIDKDHCWGTGGKTAKSPKQLYVYDMTWCNDNSLNASIFFLVIRDREMYYVKSTEVKNGDQLYKKIDALERYRFSIIQEKTAIAAAKFDSIENIRNAPAAAQQVKKLISDGVVLLDWSFKDESEYTEGTSIEFSVLNPTGKTIKYLWFTVTGYNPVGDKITDIKRKTSAITVKGVGPIKPTDSGTYEFSYVWFTDLVDKVVVNSIKVQYMDGSFKTLVNPKTYNPLY